MQIWQRIKLVEEKIKLLNRNNLFEHHYYSINQLILDFNNDIFFFPLYIYFLSWYAFAYGKILKNLICSENRYPKAPGSLQYQTAF